jgi:hypothetical protein
MTRSASGFHPVPRIGVNASGLGTNRGHSAATGTLEAHPCSISRLASIAPSFHVFLLRTGHLHLEIAVSSILRSCHGLHGCEFAERTLLPSVIPMRPHAH